MEEYIKVLGNFACELWYIAFESMSINEIIANKQYLVDKKSNILFIERYLSMHDEHALIFKIPEESINIYDFPYENYTIMKRFKLPKLLNLLPRWICRGDIICMKGIRVAHVWNNPYSHAVWTGTEFIFPFPDIFDEEFPWQERLSFSYWSHCVKPIYNIDINKMDHKTILFDYSPYHAFLQVVEVKFDTKTFFIVATHAQVNSVIGCAIRIDNLLEKVNECSPDGKKIIMDLIESGHITDHNILVSEFSSAFELSNLVSYNRHCD